MRSLAAVGVLLSMAACVDQDPTGRPSAWAEPFCATAQARVDAHMERARAERATDAGERPGGTAVVGSVAELTGGMSPVTAVDFMSRQYQQFVLLTTLVSYDAELRPVPYLARSWALGADSTSLTFHLRGDVRWHDGTPTTARDVVFTYELVTDPRSGFPNPADWEGYETTAAGIEAVDDTTVVVRLGRRADVLDPWTRMTILPEHLLGEISPEEHAQHPYATVCPVGNGPFVFVRHDPGDRWVFEANPAFPEALGGRPDVERLVHRVIPEATTLLSELLTGGIHVYPGVLPDQVERVQEEPGVELRAFPNMEVAFVAWNARRPELADARVRRALTMAVDRKEIVQAILAGHGRVARTGVPPVHWAHDPGGAPDVPHDLEGARRLLERAGWSDGDGDGVRENAGGVRLAITLKYNRGRSDRRQIAEILQARFAEVGVQATPTVVEASTLGAQVFDPAQRDFDGFIISWIQDFHLDESDFFHSARIDGPFAMSGTRRPEIDRLLDTLQTVTDRRAALPLWREYQRLVVAEQPFTYLYFLERLVGTSGRLRGAEMDARGELVSVRGWRLEAGGR